MRSLILAILLSLPMLAVGDTVHIAVAANFKHTAQAINTLFEKETGHRTKLSSASTGVLHSQIVHGAPFDVFLAADRNSPQTLQLEGHSAGGEHFCYARGQLALTGSAENLDSLNNPALTLAIANPKTAPYGRAAVELLARPEFANARERKLIRANSVTQAYQFWHTRAVDLALVAHSLALNNGTLIPLGWYNPVAQHAILLSRARHNQAAHSYIEFLQAGVIQELIQSSGYAKCS